MPRTLAVCFAHPDDESYSTYGTVALHRDDPGFRLVVLHATDGGAGEIAPGVPVSRQDLGAHRRAEDEAAWQALGAMLLQARHDPPGDGAGVDVDTDQGVRGPAQVEERLGVSPLPAVTGPPLLVPLEQRLPDGAVQQPVQAQRDVIFDPRGDDEEWGRYAKREFHVVAWPPRTAGQPVLEDVFHGLPPQLTP